MTFHGMFSCVCPLMSFLVPVYRVNGIVTVPSLVLANVTIQCFVAVAEHHLVVVAAAAAFDWPCQW